MLAVNRHMGLTIDPSGIRYVTVKKKKEWVVEKYGFFPFTEDVSDGDQINASKGLRDQLKAWIKNEKIYGMTVTLSIPTSHIIIRKLEVGTVNARELDQLIELEVETTLHLPFSDPVYDYLAATSTEHTTEALVYASRHNWIEQCSELLKDAGLKVRYAEISSLALARTIQEVQSEPLKDTMLLHLDKESTEVYLFHNDQPVFMRVINEYGHQEVVEKGLTPELIVSINAELSRLLNFYQYSIRNGESRITRVIVSGERRGRENLVAEFRAEQQDIHVDIFEFEAVDYMIPFGLAIRDRGSQSINLLPEPSTSKKMFPLTLVVTALIWVLCLGVILTLYMSNKNAIKEHESEIVELSDKAALLELQLTELNNKSESYSNPQEVIDYLKEHKQYYIEVWDELVFAMPSDTQFTNIDYSNPGSLQLTFKTKDLQDISDYLVSLRAMSFTENVKLSSFVKKDGKDDSDDTWYAQYSLKWKSASTTVEQQQTTEGGSDSNG